MYWVPLLDPILVITATRIPIVCNNLVEIYYFRFKKLPCQWNLWKLKQIHVVAYLIITYNTYNLTNYNINNAGVAQPVAVIICRKLTCMGNLYIGAQWNTNPV